MWVMRLTSGMDSLWLNAGYYDAWIIWSFWLVSAFIIGSAMGSFLHVCICRMPKGESVVNVPSHCPKCNNEIRFYDNIPIVSYLLLRGKCRKCKVKISPRYFLVEILCGLLYAAALAKVGFTAQPIATVGVYWVAVSLVVTTFFIDCKYHIIPDKTTYPAMIFGIILAVAFPSIWGVNEFWKAGLYAIVSGIIVGGPLWLFAVIGEKIAGKDVFGLGDVKYMTAIAILIGALGGYFILLLGSLFGLIQGIMIAIYRRKLKKGMTIAFGPALTIATLIWVFLGEKIMYWYVMFIESFQVLQ